MPYECHKISDKLPKKGKLVWVFKDTAPPYCDETDYLIMKSSDLIANVDKVTIKYNMWCYPGMHDICERWSLKDWMDKKREYDHINDEYIRIANKYSRLCFFLSIGHICWILYHLLSK